MSDYIIQINGTKYEIPKAVHELILMISKERDNSPAVVGERLVMDQSDFTRLINGKEVTIGASYLILSDIGFDIMAELVEEARQK